MTMETATQQAVMMVLRDAGTYDTSDEDTVHVHLTSGNELTIIETQDEESLVRHLEGEILDFAEQASDPEDVTTEYKRDGDFHIVEAYNRAAPHLIKFRLRACSDPTCWRVLTDYWL
jgi:hypothetical protein